MPIDFTQDLADNSPDFVPDEKSNLVNVPIPPEVPEPAEDEWGGDEPGEMNPGAVSTSGSQVGAWLVASFLVFLSTGFIYLKTRPVAPQTSPAPSRPVAHAASPVRARLKALWDEGAQAKRKGDYALARKKWLEGLKLEPSNRGFQESLAKLRDDSAPSGD